MTRRHFAAGGGRMGLRSGGRTTQARFSLAGRAGSLGSWVEVQPQPPCLMPALKRILSCVFSVVIFGGWPAGLLAATESAVLRTDFIYESGPYPEVHAATLAETSGGLVAAWFGGTREKHPDVGIWFSRREAGRWTTSVEVANGGQAPGADGSVVRHPCWNPVLFQPRTGPLLLFYKVGPSPQTWWGMVMESTDGGRSWSRPRRLPDGILGPIKNHPIQLPNGDLLAPTSLETPEKPSKWSVYFERSRDLGRTWERTALLNDGVEIQAIQPSLLRLGEGRLLAIGRTRQNRIFEVSSDDGGVTWGPVTLGQLPNPNSGTDAITLRDGRHLIVYNHVGGDPGKWRGLRTPLNVAVSRDGRHWQAALVLESEPGEFSYPAVIQSSDGRVHIAYTWKRQRVRHVEIDPARLTLRDFDRGEWPR